MAAHVARSNRSDQEYGPMLHEIVIAIAFLAMIAAPAYVTASSEHNERDSL
jgi:hypothetical protein